MSSQRNSNPRYGSGTVSGNLSRAGASGPTQPQPFQKGYGTGLVSLGTAKKPRTASALPERKLTVPKPVNLPSLRKENAGNDPNTQLVPSGGVGGWQKPDVKEETEESIVPNLTAGSSWASQAPSTSGIPSWQPPQPFPVAANGPQKARNLNPLEYPSLSAAATAQKQTGIPIQPHLPSAGAQNGSNWDEDERRPAFVQPKPAGESWADSKVEDERAGVYRPPWEQNGHRASEDKWTRSSRTLYTAKPSERFKEVDDPHLFPPPPPPKQPPPPPPRGEAIKAESDAEKRAFEDEIDRVIEEERRREREIQLAAAAEIARQEALEEEEAAQAAAAADQAAKEAAEKTAAEEAAKPPSAEAQQAALEAAREKALAARKRREAEDDEMDRRRKESALAKLRALEERIASRLKSEQEVKQAESTGVTQAEEALAEVQSVLAEAVEASADSAVTAAREAIDREIQGTKDIEQDATLPNRGEVGASRTDLASVEADAGSSVAPSESLEDFRPISGAGSEGGSVKDAKLLEAPWMSKPPGMATQPKAIWQRREKDSPASTSPMVGSLTESIEVPHQNMHEPSKDEPGTASLFGPSSSFGPSLVATSLGISTEDLSSAHQKSPPKIKQKEEVAASQAGPLNWRAVMGVKDPEEAEVVSVDESQASKPDTGGRGRGRGRRDRNAREDGHESGGRGRGNRERGRGRSRGRGRFAEQSISNESHDSTELGEMQAPPAEGRKGQRGRGRGRDNEARGRGRGRGNQPQIFNSIAPPPPPPPPPQPQEKQQQESPNLDDDLPPGIFPSASHTFSGSQDLQPGFGVQSKPTTDDEIGWGSLDSQRDRPALLPDLPIDKPVGLGPTLDSFNALNLEPRNDRTFDRPVDRPTSAAGAVGQPISKPEISFSNGMPNLPHDLALDSLPETSQPQNNGLAFAFPSSQHSFAPGPFQGTMFPGSQQNNPWQPRPSDAGSQPNLEAAVQSFYKGASTSEQSPQQRSAQQTSSSLQFGAFNFPQFGQLSNFGQAPFIHTGKQPDWSIGPSLTSNTLSKQQEGPSSAPALRPEFSRSVGMDTIVQPPSLQNRGPQSAPGHPAAPGPPGPPGLQRNAQTSQPMSTDSLPGDLYPNDQAVKSPAPPPGLQNPGPLPGFYNSSRTPRPVPQQGSHGPSQINVSFSAPHQQMPIPQAQQGPRPQGHLPFQGGFPEPSPPSFSQGPPPGIGKSVTPRSSLSNFPDDVFADASTPKGADPGFLQSQAFGMNIGPQGRRGGPDMRGRGIGRGPARAPTQNRGRGFGRMPMNQGGRGPGPQQQIGLMPNPNFQHPQMMGGIGPGVPQAFSLPQGLGPMGNFGPAHGPIGEQMQGPKRAPNTRGRGRIGIRQDGGPMN